jgi:hypothetical protein
MNTSNVRHPRCVLYDNTGLGMLTLTVRYVNTLLTLTVRYVNSYSRTQLYLFLILQEFTMTYFGPICGPSSGCG